MKRSQLKTSKAKQRNVMGEAFLEALGREWGGQATVLKLDLHSALGRWFFSPELELRVDCGKKKPCGEGGAAPGGGSGRYR